MAEYDFDLFAIGAGSGGVRVTRAAARYGARAAVAEERALGGTCVNVGCIPKKLLVYAAHFREDFADARGFGWSPGEASFDWATLIANKDREIERLNQVYASLLDQAGVKRIEGRARLVDPHTVRVGEQRFTAHHIVIATGGWPEKPAIPGIEHAITSNEAFHLKELPRRTLIVGGGYIAVEFAGILHGLGSHVTQLYRGPLFLRGFDRDLRTALAEEMRVKGIDLRFERNVTQIERRRDALRATLDDGSTLEADQILFATGRRPLTADLGLEALGIELGPHGRIPVDRMSRTAVPSVHAIGDVTDRINLTPVALAEAEALARTLFGGVPVAPDHTGVPACVFSQPPLGAVGLTEEQARTLHGAIDVYRSRFRPLKNTLSGNPERALLKLIVARETQCVLGVHILGPDAGEILQGFAVALKMKATKADLDATVGIHPTAAEELVTMRTPVPDA
jgi:glutathione reductase (NADPH)